MAGSMFGPNNEYCFIASVIKLRVWRQQAVSRSQNYFTTCHSHYLFCVDFVSCPSIITQTIKKTQFFNHSGRTVFYDCSICHATSCNDVYFSSTSRNNISFNLQGIPFLKTKKRNKDCLTTSLSTSYESFARKP